jgi:glycosyltransferase involved in cell wall biosynthesis
VSHPAAGTGAPLVTFFVLAYRQEAFVRAAIEGAFAQTYRPLEIILSDDSSPDATYRIMEEMAAAYSGPHRVVLNRNPVNLGLVAHLDRVMALATGDFVVQNAGDDVSRPDRAARLAAVWAAGRGEVKLVHSAMNRLDAAGRVGPRFRSPRPPLVGRDPRAVILGRDIVVGASCGWERSLWDRFGPLSPHALVEDRPIAFRAALTGAIAWLDEPLLNYRAGGDSDHVAAGSEPVLGAYHVKRQQWRRSYMQSYLDALERVAPPDAEALRRLCRDRMALIDFELALAAAGPAGRMTAMPQAVARAVRHHDTAYLRLAGKYLFARSYERVVARRRRRARALHPVPPER